MIPHDYDMNYPIEIRRCPACRYCTISQVDVGILSTITRHYCGAHFQDVDSTGHCGDFAKDRRFLCVDRRKEERRKF